MAMTNGKSSPRYDWDSIELEYKGGIIPVPAICARHGVSRSRLDTAIKNNGWERRPPSSLEVYGAAATGFTPTAPTNSFSPEAARMTAMSAAGSVLEVHRAELARLRNVATNVMERLAGMLGLPGGIIEQPVVITSDKGDITVQFPLLGKTESVTDVLRKLSLSYQLIVEMERANYGLDALPPETGEGEANLEIESMWARLDEIANGKRATLDLKAEPPTGKPN